MDIVQQHFLTHLKIETSRRRRRRGAELQNTRELGLVPGKIFEYLSEKYPELIPKGKNLPKHAHLGKSKETGVSFDTIIRFSRLELFIIINDHNDIDFDH